MLMNADVGEAIFYPFFMELWKIHVLEFTNATKKFNFKY